MSARRRWRNVWTAPDERLVVQAREEDSWTRHRIVSNSEGDGAVAVVVDGTRVLFIEAERPAIGQTLWEMPRGQADAVDGSPCETAARELLEETGRVATGSHFLGQIWAESGLSGDAVNVVVIRVDPRAEPIPAEYAAQRWIEIDRFRDEVSNGQIRDGISISACVLAWSEGVFNRSSFPSCDD